MHRMNCRHQGLALRWCLACCCRCAIDCLLDTPWIPPPHQNLHRKTGRQQEHLPTGTHSLSCASSIACRLQCRRSRHTHRSIHRRRNCSAARSSSHPLALPPHPLALSHLKNGRGKGKGKHGGMATAAALSGTLTGLLHLPLPSRSSRSASTCLSTV